MTTLRSSCAFSFAEVQHRFRKFGEDRPACCDGRRLTAEFWQRLAGGGPQSGWSPIRARERAPPPRPISNARGRPRLSQSTLSQLRGASTRQSATPPEHVAVPCPVQQLGQWPAGPKHASQAAETVPLSPVQFGCAPTPNRAAEPVPLSCPSRTSGTLASGPQNPRARPQRCPLSTVPWL